jgi:hypothetical protein
MECVKIFKILIFLGKKKKKKNCKDLGVGQDLIEFARIPTHEFLKNYFIIFFKKKKTLKILI